jgi:hypothetical protein
MKKISVISQSMYFPWCGLLNQVLLADSFIHYNDVQFSRGFFNRVQVKTAQGLKWMTVPLQKHRQNQLINDVFICYDEDWISQHRKLLVNSLKGASHFDDAIMVFDDVTKVKHESISELSKSSVEIVSDYLKINLNTEFLNSAELNVPGSSSQRLLDLTKKVMGTKYLTGHGAFNYLAHELFESEGVDVSYMDYFIKEYKQFHGDFTPYVTCLDAIAHLGKEAKNILQSKTIDWREFNERTTKI